MSHMHYLWMNIEDIMHYDKIVNFRINPIFANSLEICKFGGFLEWLKYLNKGYRKLAWPDKEVVL